MLMPVALIEMGETENVGFNFFNFFPVDLQFKVLVKLEETDIAVAAENRCDCWIATTLKPFLKTPVCRRWNGRTDSMARMAVKMAKQPVAKSFQLTEQNVCGFELAFYANCSPDDMLKSAFLIESQDPINF